jgi:hypothetical protein
MRVRAGPLRRSVLASGFVGRIRGAMADIATDAAVGRDVFMVDRMRQDAVVRTFEIR